MTTQTEAERLAKALEGDHPAVPGARTKNEAAAELRRLVSFNQQLMDEVARLQKREWVGLTDEEIEQGCKESWVTLQAWQSAVWWAEDKLKEKNT